MLRRSLSIVLILSGIILIGFSTSSLITGFVVLNDIFKGSFSIFGLAFVIGGLVLFMISKENDLENIIYKYPGKNREFKDYIADPESYFTTQGGLEINEFAKEVEEIRSDPELFGLVRETYVFPLIQIAEREDGEKSELAKKCLKILDMDYINEDQESNENKREIISAFRDYKGGRPNKKQMRILKRNGLKYVEKTPHSKLVDSENNTIVTLPNSGSDKREGLNIATEIARYLNKEEYQ